MNKFDMMSKDALSKMEEIMNASRLSDLLHRKEEEEKKKKAWNMGPATGCIMNDSAKGR